VVVVAVRVDPGEGCGMGDCAASGWCDSVMVTLPMGSGGGGGGSGGGGGGATDEAGMAELIRWAAVRGGGDDADDALNDSDGVVSMADGWMTL
jgi:hypothetical protein